MVIVCLKKKTYRCVGVIDAPEIANTENAMNALEEKLNTLGLPIIDSIYYCLVEGEETVGVYEKKVG